MQAIKRRMRRRGPEDAADGSDGAPDNGGLRGLQNVLQKLHIGEPESPTPATGEGSPTRSPSRLRVPWKRRERSSEESTGNGSNNSTNRSDLSSAHSPQLQTLPLSQPNQLQPAPQMMVNSTSNWSARIPFPMVRSQSSVSVTPPLTKVALEPDRPRRRTEGEKSILDSPKREVEGPLPPHSDDDDVLKYAQLVEQTYAGDTCSALARDSSPFLARAMLAYVKSRFSFVDEPVDMALRKFLLYNKLPVETQQVERVLECFGRVYHEDNPWAFADPDQAYFVVFSMVILHTDTFNKHVKHKMAKEDYVRSAYCDDIPVEVFEYIYDNITCAQFVHAEDAVIAPLMGARSQSQASLPTVAALPSSKEKSATPTIEEPLSASSRRSTSFGWSRQDMEPYTLILEGNLAPLRPNLGSVLVTSDPFEPTLVETPTEFAALRSRFAAGPTIQLVSQRSRPDAWQSDVEDRARLSTQNLLQITTPGVVEIKVVKIGILLRREPSKKMLPYKNSWREWGAILTESQLYLFKNVAWVKSIIETPSTGTITRAPMDGFNATTISSTKDMAAMRLTSDVESHDNGFILTGRGGSQQWFAAKTEEEALDWIHNINFAAAFSTYHVGPVPTAGPSSHQLTKSSSDTSLASHAHHVRATALAQQIGEIDRKAASIQEQITLIERQSRHLQILAPLQQKTREMLVFAVGQCSSKCEYCWLDRARLKCYRNMLELDLKLEKGDNMIQSPAPSTNRSIIQRTATPETFVDAAEGNNTSDCLYFSPRMRTYPSMGSLGPQADVSPSAGRFSLVNVNPDIVHQSPKGSDRSSNSDIARSYSNESATSNA